MGHSRLLKRNLICAQILNMYAIIILLLIRNVYSEKDPSMHKNWKHLNNEICGHSATDRIIGGKNATLGAYPWIARIGYVSWYSSKVQFRCGAVIINERTALTAAHCVYNLPPGRRVEVVRFGEHYTDTDPDCEDNICAEPVQDVSPSEIIIHSDYNKLTYKNDIAIIRFKKDVRFNDYVRPICMISGVLMTKNYVGSVGEVAGWGIYNISSRKASKILLTISMPIVDNVECNQAFKRYVMVDRKQICVGGMVGQDSCSGDSGGPLMKVEDIVSPPRYYLIGIVSFGNTRCGSSPIPGVYTRMSEYMSWVLDNLLDNTVDYKIVQTLNTIVYS